MGWVAGEVFTLADLTEAIFTIPQSNMKLSCGIRRNLQWLIKNSITHESLSRDILTPPPQCFYSNPTKQSTLWPVLSISKWNMGLCIIHFSFEPLGKSNALWTPYFLFLLSGLWKTLQTCAFSIPNTIAQRCTGNILLWYNLYYLII